MSSPNQLLPGLGALDDRAADDEDQDCGAGGDDDEGRGSADSVNGYEPNDPACRLVMWPDS